MSFTPGIVVHRYGARREAFWTGMLKCGNQSACPVCAERRAAERASELDAMMRADQGARWQMVTLTLRHHAGNCLASEIGRLMAAWRRVRATRAVRRIMDVHVRASARALEVTRGENGWHPHLHILWHTSRWTAHEQRILLREWARALDQRAFLAPLLRWSTAIHEWARERARYISKLGAEVSGIGKESSRSPWTIARKAADGDETSIRLWSEYQAAMKGRRILELDERAKALAAAGASYEEPSETWTITFYGEEVRAFASVEPINRHILLQILEAGINATSPPEAIDAFLRRHLEMLSVRPSRIAA